LPHSGSFVASGKPTFALGGFDDAFDLQNREVALRLAYRFLN
jgi:hypothetical protein